MPVKVIPCNRYMSTQYGYNSKTNNVHSSLQPSLPPQYTFKVIVVGDLGVGKTALIKRYVKDQFSAFYKGTIGVDCASRVVNYQKNVRIKVQMYDISGQERFHELTRVFYKDAMAAIVVYDLTRFETLENSKRWKEDIDEKVHIPNTYLPIPTILVGNKSDLASDCAFTTLDEDVMKGFCLEHGFSNWFAVSAKSKVNVDRAMDYVIGECLRTRIEVIEKPQCDLNDLSANSIKLCSEDNAPSKPTDATKKTKKWCML